MESLPELIARVCRDTHLPMVQEVFGQNGVDATFQIMETAKVLYRHVELERVKGSITIYQKIQSENQSVPGPPNGPPVDFAGLANLVLHDLVFEIAIDGRAYQRSTLPQSPGELAKGAVVYHYSGGREEFIAGLQRKEVLRLDPSARSQFSVPTFPTLREALQHYAHENIRESTCVIFRSVWADTNRLFFRAGPESQMRDSLVQFLKNRLGAEHDVMPEQNVDLNHNHPVDIRVTTRFTNNRLMLIEIKWLGSSVADDGHITATHKERRAQEGADQLADYLESQIQTSPSRIAQGYYVIIDGRRRDLHEGDAMTSHENGMYFEGKAITFTPAYETARNDFDPPYQMFARPICTN